MTAAIALEQVRKTYGGLSVLAGASFHVQPGEFAAIVGPSGCGKSTALRLLAGLDRSDEGRVLAEGEEVGGPGPRRLLVFQDHALYPWRTVLDNVVFGLELARMPHREAVRRGQEALIQFGLAGFESYYPHQLSGGMRQRASLARAFVMRPDVLLLDEPYGALDALTRMAMQDELRDLWQITRMTVLLVTHDVEEALYLADRVLVMSPRPGRVVGEVAVSLPHPRHRSAPEFQALRQQLLDQLGLASGVTAR